MGGCASNSANTQSAPDLEDEKSPTLEQHGPRWDDDGFNEWADDCRLQWLNVEYVRQLHDTSQLFPGCQDCSPSGVHVGAPPNGVELFNVIHRYLGFKKPKHRYFDGVVFSGSSHTLDRFVGSAHIEASIVCL